MDTAGRCFLLIAALGLVTGFPRRYWQEVSSEEPEVHKLTEIAVREYNRLSNQDVVYLQLRVTDVKKQLVSGVKYDFNILLGRTLCKKDREETLKKCQLHFAALEKGVKCNFSVLLVPWLNETKVLHQLCSREDFIKDGADPSSRPSIKDKLPSQMKDKLLEKLSSFKEFVTTYNKSYQNDEEALRRLHIFSENLKKAKDIQKKDQGTAEYGITKFSDLTEAVPAPVQPCLQAGPVGAGHIEAGPSHSSVLQQDNQGRESPLHGHEDLQFGPNIVVSRNSGGTSCMPENVQLQEERAEPPSLTPPPPPPQASPTPPGEVPLRRLTPLSQGQFRRQSIDLAERMAFVCENILEQRQRPHASTHVVESLALIHQTLEQNRVDQQQHHQQMMAAHHERMAAHHERMAAHNERMAAHYEMMALHQRHHDDIMGLLAVVPNQTAALNILVQAHLAGVDRTSDMHEGLFRQNGPREHPLNITMPYVAPGAHTSSPGPSTLHHPPVFHSPPHQIPHSPSPPPSRRITRSQAHRTSRSRSPHSSRSHPSSH